MSEKRVVPVEVVIEEGRMTTLQERLRRHWWDRDTESWVEPDALNLEAADALDAKDKRIKELEWALERIEDGLRKAGATLPAPEVTGTIEGAMNTGMCIALALVSCERAALKGE